LALLAESQFLILVHVIPNLLQNSFQRICLPGSIPEFTFRQLRQTTLFLLAGAMASMGLHAAENPDVSQREDFSRAWRAAAHGKRADFEQLMPGLQAYLLYPYLQYEDLRYRRARVSDAEMASFLEDHEDWAFTAGLKTAWLRTLGARSRWDSLIEYAPGSSNTEVQCYLAQARIKRGRTDGLLPVAQALWTVGKSQPDACDPVFSWLKKQDGITTGLAWERIRRAMDAREPRLTLYLARFLGEEDRVWADRWYQQDRSGYRQLKQAGKWPDQEKSRDITSYGLRRLARNDSDRAAQIYETIEKQFNWTADVRGGILREIALWSAVEGVDATPARMRSVPEPYRDGKLLEWWVRYDLSKGDWGGVILTIAAMAPEQKDDTRWRYWDARARFETGNAALARELLGELALGANYYGFLSADQLALPYTICQQEPSVTEAEVATLKEQGGFGRALELWKAGIPNWSRSEWKTAVRGLDKKGLQTAAALAVQEGWPDMAIFALGNSGDLRWYEWRFPIENAKLVEEPARNRNLDLAWVMGLMRSESAMAVDALSPAGARGLMQIMPNTAKTLAKRHSFSYTGHQQLMQAQDNIEFGTAYLRDLLDRFDGNQALVSGAYNAGPHVVDRWMDKRQTNDPAIWVETIPYFETRDYIPRVLAFSTIYDWRLQKPVSRLSSRMPVFDSSAVSGTMPVRETAEVVCRTPG
jgi:soluble lytic murein transglycosylase